MQIAENKQQNNPSANAVVASDSSLAKRFPKSRRFWVKGFDGQPQLRPLSRLLLMSVLSKTLLTLMRCHLMPFSFLSAWHVLRV